MKRETTLLKFVVLLLMLLPLLFIGFTIHDFVYGDYDIYSVIIAGVYVSAIPFWFALYQALKLLNYIDKGEAFTPASTGALRRIKYGAMAITGLYGLGLPWLFIAADQDDAPGVFALGFVIVGASVVVATFAAVLQKLLHSAMTIKSENDLTV